MASAFIAVVRLMYLDRMPRVGARMRVLGCVLVLAVNGVPVKANAVFAFGPLLVYLSATAGRLRWMAADEQGADRFHVVQAAFLDVGGDGGASQPPA